MKDGFSLRRLGEQTKTALLGAITAQIPLPTELAARRVAFVGASVGHAWRLPLVFPNVTTYVHYEFDKGPPLAQALDDAADGVIIKECAAYFPLAITLAQAGDLVRSWIDRLRRSSVRPALATVVPVSRGHEAVEPGRAAGLWDFNDWVREYARSEDIPLVDLELALRDSPSSRFLREGLDTGDGLHLRRSTYRRYLDPLIPPLLHRMFGS